MNNFKEKRINERGGAGIKMLIVGVILFLIGFASYNYIPTAYDAQNFKQDMQSAVLQASAVTQGVSPIDSTKLRILKAVTNNNIPPNPYIEVKQDKNGLQARVYYIKKVPIIPFGIYNYQYQFDYTATPTGFLFKQ